MQDKTKKMSVPFTQIANSLLNNSDISFKAKGIYAFLYSKPSGWRFEAKRISNQSADGVDSIYSGLKELEKFGYLVRHKQSDGGVEYELFYESQIGKKPIRENPCLGKSQSGKNGCISNKENIVINNNSNKEETPSNFAISFFSNSEPIIDELIKSGLPDKIVRAEVTKFISYWTEPNKTGKKQRWELEKVFDVKRRLGSWFRNYVKFNTVEKTSNNKITFVG